MNMMIHVMPVPCTSGARLGGRDPWRPGVPRAFQNYVCVIITIILAFLQYICD